MFDTIVIGGGLSGLTAAYRLSSANHKVLLLESSPILGGRARKAKFNNNIVDNGQHLCIGAYIELLKLCEDLNINIKENFLRNKFCLKMYTNNQKYELKFKNILFPFNIVYGFLTIKNIKFIDKLKTIIFFIKIFKKKFQLTKDITVDQLFKFYKIPESIKNIFLQPLALAALTTPTNIASAQIFLNVCKDAFKSSHSSDFLFPRKDLSSLLPNKIKDYIIKYNSQVKTKSRVKEIFKDNLTYIIKTNNDEYYARNIILATPPSSIDKIFTNFEIAKPMVDYFPITTIYIEFEEELNLDDPMIGLVNTTGQFVFHRKFCNQGKILAIVISCPDITKDKIDLFKVTFSEIKKIYPKLPKVINYKIITEKKAAISVTKKRDLKYQINEKNIYICGDYTEKQYPSTMESAVMSGNRIAREVDIASLT